jgi:hypothetical protein
MFSSLGIAALDLNSVYKRDPLVDELLGAVRVVYAVGAITVVAGGILVLGLLPLVIIAGGAIGASGLLGYLSGRFVYRAQWQAALAVSAWALGALACVAILYKLEGANLVWRWFNGTPWMLTLIAALMAHGLMLFWSSRSWLGTLPVKP